LGGIGSLSQLKGTLGIIVLADFDPEDFDADDFNLETVETYTNRYQLRGLAVAGKLRGIQSGRLRGIQP
jgi:hypothetical protein